MNQELQEEMPAETTQTSLVNEMVPWQKGHVCSQLSPLEKGAPLLRDLPIFQEKLKKKTTYFLSFFPSFFLNVCSRCIWRFPG